MKKFLACLCLFACSASSWANDTAFGGEGGALFPIQNSDVRMVDEHVVLEGQVANGSLVAWNVSCTFNFKNESAQAVDLKIGFPFPSPEEIAELETTTPPGRQKTASLIYDFKAMVKGKEIQTVETQLAKPVSTQKDENGEEWGGYTHAWTFDVHFEPGESIQIVNTYVTGVTQDVEHVIWPSYVLKTGANWKDAKIGRSLVEIKPNTLFKMGHEISLDSYKPEITGWKLEGIGDSQKIVWDLKDFTPTSDLRFGIYTADAYAKHLISECMRADEFTAKDLRICRNLPYAMHGYQFKKKEMKTHFEKQWWYQSNPDFDKKSLSRDEMKFIKEMKKLEKMLK